MIYYIHLMISGWLKFFWLASKRMRAKPNKVLVSLNLMGHFLKASPPLNVIGRKPYNLSIHFIIHKKESMENNRIRRGRVTS